MSLPPPRDPAQFRRITPTRVVVWVAVAGAGIFLLLSGITGIIAKG